MADYKGSVELISGLIQKNNGDFPLVDATAVQYDATGKNVKQAIDDLAAGEGNETITTEEIDELFN